MIQTCISLTIPPPPPVKYFNDMITSKDGNMNQYFLSANTVINWKRNLILQSKKDMNRQAHAMNGNRSRTSPIKIVHWNAGSRLWENKLLEIETLLLEKSPDLCFISEANLWESLPDWERQLPGYYLIYPNTFNKLKTCKNCLGGKK